MKYFSTQIYHLYKISICWNAFYFLLESSQINKIKIKSLEQLNNEMLHENNDLIERL